MIASKQLKTYTFIVIQTYSPTDSEKKTKKKWTDFPLLFKCVNEINRIDKQTDKQTDSRNAHTSRQTHQCLHRRPLQFKQNWTVALVGNYLLYINT